MEQKCQSPVKSAIPATLDKLGDINQSSDNELKMKLQYPEYKLQKKYHASQDYIYRKIAGSDVLISVGSNIANFNGYIEINKSAADLWNKLQTPCTLDELGQLLEEKYGIDHDNAMKDVLYFIRDLQEHDMVMVQ